MRKSEKSGARSPVILVIRFSSLGDIALMLPMLRELRKGYPGGEIHLATKSEYSGLLEGNGDVDFIHCLPDTTLASSLKLFRALGKIDFDMVIDAHGVLRSVLISAFLSAGKKIRIDKEQLKKTLLIKGSVNYYKEIHTQSGRYLDLATRSGVALSGERYLIDIPRAADIRAGALLAEAGIEDMPLVAFAPGARWPAKQWPAEYFSDLVSALAARGFGCVMTGSAGEKALCETIKRPSAGSLNAAGRLSIMESAALLGKCRLLVTNDSAPLHLAEAAGTPVVAFFGPTAREFGFFPLLPESKVLERDLACRPCSRNGSKECRFGTRECLVSITQDAALEAVLEILDREPISSGRPERKA
jgi:heptosyltransferase-2